MYVNGVTEATCLLERTTRRFDNWSMSILKFKCASVPVSVIGPGETSRNSFLISCRSNLRSKRVLIGTKLRNKMSLITGDRSYCNSITTTLYTRYSSCQFIILEGVNILVSRYAVKPLDVRWEGAVQFLEFRNREKLLWLAWKATQVQQLGWVVQNYSWGYW